MRISVWRRITLLFVFFIISVSNLSADNQDETAIPDSLLTYKYIVSIYMDDPERAQKIFDIVKERKLHMPEYELDYLQGSLYWRIDKYHLSIFYYERYLNNEALKDNRIKQMHAMSAILSSAEQCNDYEKISKYTHRMIEIAQGYDDNDSQGCIASAYYHLGAMYWALQQRDKALANYDKAIEILQDIDQTAYQEYLTDYLINISLKLQYIGWFDRAMEYNRLVYENIEKLKNMPETDDGILEQYPVMYTILMANTLAGLGQMDESDKYYKEFLEYPAEQKYGLNGFIEIYLFNAGKYKEVLQYELGRLSRYRAANDTVTTNVVALKRNIAKAYEGLEIYDKSSQYYKEVIDIKDSLNYEERMSHVREFSVIHDVQEKENQIQEQKSTIFIHKIVLVTISIIVVFVIILLVIWIRNSRKLKIKNIGLVNQMREQDRLNKELSREKAEADKLRKIFGETNGVQVQENPQDELFGRLETLMEEKRLYTDSSLNRKTIADMLGTNEKYLREAIKNNMDVTVNGYINLLRLRYAKELLLKPADEYTIEGIALESGFGARSTFHTLFRNHYGLTPDEFRKIIQEGTSPDD